MREHPIHRIIPSPGGAVRVSEFAGVRPSICALHGFTGSGEDFTLLAEQLNHHLVAPDLCGHGPLSSDLESSLIEEGQRLQCLLAELQEPPVLLGYSMGGRTALAWALRNPSAFSALILVGASPGLRLPSARAERQASDEALAQRIESEGVPAFADFWEQVPIIASQERIPLPYRAALQQRRREHRAAGLTASLRGMGTGAQASYWDALQTFSLPTLLVTGADDLKFLAIAEEMERLLPTSRRVAIPGAGHCAHLEQAEETGRAIAAFIEGLGSTSP
jgi:2-succinyl-6-hydroxy-2,4-cyclohexadiene-1-carboxylate synthase